MSLLAFSSALLSVSVSRIAHMVPGHAIYVGPSRGFLDANVATGRQACGVVGIDAFADVLGRP